MTDDLVSTLRAASGRQDRQSHRAVLLNPSSDRDRRRLDELAPVQPEPGGRWDRRRRDQQGGTRGP
ncbi:MAG: hypothetical protein ACT4NY_25005 [Pseudonocardiales bacterium]